MSGNRAEIESIKNIMDTIANDDRAIFGLILLQFGSEFTNEELAEVISQNKKFNKERVLSVIKLAKKVALNSMFTT